MGLFDSLKKAFGGGEPRDEGLYFYIKPDRTDEIVRLRLEPKYDLNRDYDAGGYVSRKEIVSPRKFKRASATFRFDENRKLVEWDIVGGQLVTEEEWQAQQTQNEEPEN